MPVQQQDKQRVEQANQERQRRNAAIGKHVMHSLGQPGGLQKVQVRPLWEHHYRVNVLVGMDAASASVAHSFFLVVDGDDNILASTPKIKKQY